MNRTRTWLALVLILPAFGADEPSDDVPGVAVLGATADPYAPVSVDESLSAWQFRVPVVVEKAAASGADADKKVDRKDESPQGAPLFEFVLPPAVFDRARLELSDLRLCDETGRFLPFAIRVRHPQSESATVPAEQFNRVTADDGTHELSLDLGESPTEHDSVELLTEDTDTTAYSSSWPAYGSAPATVETFLRRVEIAGSDDRETWKHLTTGRLVQWNTQPPLRERIVKYAPSRFRYLRVRVQPDPTREKDDTTIRSATVRRQVEVPGEYEERTVTLSERSPVRVLGRPGSAWQLDLGGDRVPCDRITVDCTDKLFHREFLLEQSVGDPRVGTTWQQFHNGQLIRQPSDRQPLTAGFPELQARRLRLAVQDHANPPLNITAVRVRAAVRVIVFALDGAGGDKLPSTPLYLYFGHPRAESPQYDFARNLPAKLVPRPQRLSVGERELNPAYVAPPQPLTERWPWLVYAVLGVAVAVLAALIANLARATIARSESEAAAGEVAFP